MREAREVVIAVADAYRKDQILRMESDRPSAVILAYRREVRAETVREIVEKAKAWLHENKGEIVKGREDRSLTDIIEDAAWAMADALLKEEE